MKSKALFAAVAAALLGAAVPVTALELFVDDKTGQVYTTPGKGRTKLGDFVKVDEAAPKTPPSEVKELEARLDKRKAQLEAIEKRMEKKESAIKEIETKVEKIAKATPPHSDPAPAGWYEKLSLRGYTQFRYNQPISGNNVDLASPGDRSISNNQNLLIRRARLIISGDISDYLSLYVQPDLASNVSVAGTTADAGHYAQLRDAYADIFFDKHKEYRVRVGQSKIPYGFEILQSSQNRLAMDRADAINTAARDERDIGAFFYWAPENTRELFRNLVRGGLKGSGDYGVLGLGVYNGQGANRFETNDNFHIIARASYPYKFDNGQIFEAGVSAYTGRFIPGTSTRNSRLTRKDSNCSDVKRVGNEFECVSRNVAVAPTLENSKGLIDERVAVHAVLYPKPFGLQSEWNWGRSPEFSEDRRSVTTASINGGYVQAMYKLDHWYGTWIPYAKWQYYDGAEKFASNAPHVDLNETEIGVEWQPMPEIELVAAYSNMNRTNVSSLKKANADLLRIQLQWNY